MHRILTLTLVLALVTLAAAEGWIRNTYPGPGHVANPGPWGPGQGSDRCEWVAGFGVHPLDPEFMLMCTDLGGLSVATDGAEFRPASLPVRHGHALAFDPHAAGTAYALMSDPYTGQELGGWWRSTDRGASWELILRTHPVRAHARRLVVDRAPARSNHLYVATDHGLLRSTDGGSAWEVCALAGEPIWSLAMACDGSSLYVLAGKGRRKDCYRIDHGEPASLRRLEARLVSIDTHPSDPAAGAAVDGSHAYAFTDRGETMGAAIHRDGHKGLTTIRINPANPDHLIAYAWGGLASRPFHFSADGGVTWARWRIEDGRCSSLVDYAPLNHDSPDWQLDAEEMMFEGDRDLVGFVPGDPDAVVMWASNYVKGPLRSDDSGANFRPFGHGGQFKAAAQTAIGGSPEVMAVARNEYGFVITRDGGRTWRGYGRHNVPAFRFEAGKPLWRFRSGWGVAFDPRDDRILIGSFGWDPLRIVRSEDGGGTWREIHTVASHDLRNEDLRVHWHPQDPHVIYAAGLRSEDGGESWEAMDHAPGAIDPADGDRLLARPERNRLVVSADRGRSWQTVPDLPGQDAVSYGWDNFAVDPTVRGEAGWRLLITGRNGVWCYRSASAALAPGSWRQLATGIDPTTNLVVDAVWFSDVLFDPRPGHRATCYLLAGHSGPGKGNVWRRQTYRSHDGGESWAAICGPAYPGLPDVLPPSDGIVCPHSGTFTLLNTSGNYSLLAAEE
jgi:photosystem II stability/assembly factor-like uncharacterized protein